MSASLVAAGLLPLLVSALSPQSASQVAPGPIGRASVSPPPVMSAPPLPDAAVPAPRLQVSDAAPPILPADLDDSPPWPREARYVAEPDGDQRVAGAGGDPYYLGFAGGEWRPPAGERLDPALVSEVEPTPLDGRPAARVFAFAMFEGRITDERLAELERAGARVLGLHPSNCVKVAFAPEALERVAYLPFVRWLGAPRRWQKQQPQLAAARATAPANEPMELWVDVYESDLGPDSTSEPVGTMDRVDAGQAIEVTQDARRARVVHSRGWQERALAALGLEVLEYVDSLRAFRVRALPAAVELVLDRDFVQYVELAPAGEFENHDAVPMSNSDFVRYYLNGGTSQAVIAGQIDSGFDAAHADLSHAWGWGWSVGGTGGAWNDVCEHGSHVAGILLGNGGIKPEYAGNAPGLGWGPSGRFYNVKTSDACSGWSFSLASAMSVLHTPIFDGTLYTPIPHVVNNSWGSTTAGPWMGTEADARLIDGEVYGLGQMYVFAAGNAGPGASTVTLQGSAKNAFTVGNVSTYWNTSNLPGILESDSSRGPTADFRWKPNIAAPGRWVWSVDANSGTGHAQKGGTSMAAPAVSGIAALMMDQMSWLRYVPERVASLMMATSLAKDGVALTTQNDTHLTNYGAGRADAFRALFGTAQNTWSNWGAYLPANNYTYADFTIGAGCTRMVVCMHYVEPAASAGASQAMISDYNLILDAPPIDPSFSVGDYTAQQSARNNTEIRVLNNPTPGTWRWKIWPENAPQGVYYGLTVMVTYGDTTPAVTVTTVPAKTYLKPGEQTDVTVTVANNDYVATNVVLEPQYWQYGSAWASKVTKRLADLTIAEDFNIGANVSLNLGDIPATGARVSTYRTSWASEGNWGFIANVRGENVPATSHMGVVFVDGTPPGAVGALTCSNFPVGSWVDHDGTGAFAWTAATDNLSGVLGYSVSLSQGAPGTPDAVVDTSGLTWSAFLASAAQPWYLNVRAVDKCGNAGPVASVGPIYIDATAPSAPTGFSVVAHQPNVSSTNPRLEASWTASDGQSGVAAYAAVWDTQASTDPGTAITTTQPVLTRTFTVTAPMQAWLHVRAIDAVGHVGPVAHYGPFPLQPVVTQSYCTAKVTSLGCVPVISSSGTPIAQSGPDDFQLRASGVNGQSSGYLLWGLSTGATPVGGGIAVVGHTPRGVVACLKVAGSENGLTTGGGAGSCSGQLVFDASESWMAAHGLTAGMDVYAQFVLIDPQQPDGSGVAHSEALRFTIGQ